MRHAKKRYQLNRSTSLHKATLKSMARNILIYQSITTTKMKAKAVRPLVDKLIALAQDNTLAAKRRAFQILGDHALVSRLFGEIGPRFRSIGGSTRILSLGSRRGDNAQLVILELTQIVKKEIRKPQKQASAAEAKSVDTSKPEKEVAKAEKPKTEPSAKEKPPISQKPSKKFLGGLRQIFKKERDSL